MAYQETEQASPEQ